MSRIQAPLLEMEGTPEDISTILQKIWLTSFRNEYQAKSLAVIFEGEARSKWVRKVLPQEKDGFDSINIAQRKSANFSRK